MTPKATGKRTILVVEDEPDSRHLMVRTLSQASFNVLETDNGAEALRLLAAHTVHLVITDILMPDMDGFELIGKLRRHRPRPRILAVSGGGMIESAEHLHTARMLGADHVLAKPFSGSDLLTAVNALLPTPH